MSLINTIQLLVLAAIWGASFMFMRIAAPVLGPGMLIETRVGLAAVFLLVVSVILKKKLNAVKYWRHYLFLGIFNTAIPFLLFAYAALTITASELSILNSTAPIWGTMIAAIWFRNKISLKEVIGLMMGVSGVVVLIGFDTFQLQSGNLYGILAAIMAAGCYGVASVYTRAVNIKQPYNNAHGSMWAAALVILPLLPFFPAQPVESQHVLWSVILLGVLCTGIAYLIYFRLIEQVGAPSALTVTFLIPMFGIFWGYLFLDEIIGWHTLTGAVLVVSGTVFVTGFSFRKSVSVEV